MPELPEVEVARRQLARWAGGQPITGLRVPDPAVVRARWSTRPSDALEQGVARLESAVGGVAGEPTRHGKRLGWVLGAVGLGLHLGMTGRWVRRLDEQVPRFGRLALGIDGQSWLWFEDSRRFGCVVPVAPDGVAELLGGGLGADALRSPPDGLGLRALITGRRPIKVALMDQAKLAGLGNIHAAEALFRARVAPGRPAASLTEAEWALLAEVIPLQLAESVTETDSDEVTYVTRGGDNPFSVYKRAGEPCPRCGAAIALTRLGGRATYACTACQR